jgi:hypothetical protein
MSAPRECRLFAQASERGLRRVHNFVQAVKGLCKKEKPISSWSTELSMGKPLTPNPEDTYILNQQWS